MKLNQISAIVMACCASQIVGAAEQLAPIEVRASLENSAIGHYVFSSEELKKRIAKDKTINNVVANLPSVRTAAAAQASDTQGEITPQNLSFYGEKYYNNHFIVNGVSVNDNVNPIGLGATGYLSRARTLTADPEELPAGHPQLFWTSPDLVERVNVYDSNVPSSYGQFTGGVVEAELKEPDATRHSGAVSYRTTRSSWTKFHLDGEQKEAFHRAYSPLMQPKFTKHQYHLQLNQPLSVHSALLFAYDRQASSIPQQQRYLNQTTEQKRRNETFLLSYKNEFNDNNSLLANVMYSPHLGDYYLDNVKNGGFRESGGGWLGVLKWLNYNQLGLLTTQFSYRATKNQTRYSSHTLSNFYRTPSIDWLSEPDPSDPMWDISREGGLGTRFTQQKQLQLKQSLDFEPWERGDFSQQFSLGWTFQHNRSALKQRELAETNNYYLLKEGERFTDTDCTECIPGEQYKYVKTHFFPINAQVKHNRVAFYLQDKLQWRNLTLNTGLRADHGQFIKTWNIAPRFYFDYDVAGQNRTHLIGGYNRYYADDLLDYQLRSSFNIGADYSRKPDLSGWDYQPKQLSKNYRGARLKTPYSDELNLGISQKWANSLWSLKWVQRHSKDQFVTKLDQSQQPNRYYLTNAGRSKTNTVSLEVRNVEALALQAVRFDWKFAMSYEKSRSNQTVDYTQRDWADYGITKMIYKNKLHSIDQMPAQTFNDPWRASFQLNSHFPKLNFTWLQQLNYSAGARSFQRTGFRCTAEQAVCEGYQGLVAKVVEYKQWRNFTLDWSFIWKKSLGQHSAFTLDMSVFNVLNRIAKVELADNGEGTTYQSYQAGRQFWLGAKLEW